MALDAKVYEKEHQSTEETTNKRLEINAMTDITVMDGDHLVGYISLYPVSEDDFYGFLKCKHSDSFMETRVIPYNRHGVYCAYLSSIVVDKNKYPDIAGKFLFGYLQNHILKLRKRGVFINKIIAVAVSPSGRRSLKRMAFKEVAKDIMIYSCFKQGVHFVLDRSSLYNLSYLIKQFDALFKGLLSRFQNANFALHALSIDPDT